MNFGYVTVNGVNSNENGEYLFLKFTVGYYTDCFKKSQGFFQYLQCESGNVTVHSVHSNVAKIHSRLPTAMEFWLVCLGILAYSCQNTSRDSGV